MINAKAKWLLNYRMAMAPMVDVTDYPFRQLVSLYSKLNSKNTQHESSTSLNNYLTWTEFISVDGLVANPNKFKPLLEYSKIQRPIVCQLFGHDPEKFRKATAIVKDMGFDCVDLNFGCPVRKVVERQSAGSALIVDRKTAVNIVEAVKDEAGESMPVFVKTRIGFDEIDIEGWVPTLLNTKPDLLTLHLRTKKELSNCPAHWENNVIGRALDLNQQHKNNNTLIFGNGDIESIDEINNKFNEYPLLNGVMVGRGVYGTPWFFNSKESQDTLTMKNKLEAMVEHALLIEQHRSKFNLHIPNLSSLNIHIKSYCNTLSHLGDISPLRSALTKVNTSKEIVDLLNLYLTQKNILPNQHLDHSTINLQLQSKMNEAINK